MIYRPSFALEVDEPINGFLVMICRPSFAPRSRRADKRILVMICRPSFALEVDEPINGFGDDLQTLVRPE
jgi:hypothetical protein